MRDPKHVQTGRYTDLCRERRDRIPQRWRKGAEKEEDRQREEWGERKEEEEQGREGKEKKDKPRQCLDRDAQTEGHSWIVSQWPVLENINSFHKYISSAYYASNWGLWVSQWKTLPLIFTMVRGTPE